MMYDESVILNRFRALVDREKTRDSMAKKMTEQGLSCNTSTITKHYNGDRKISTEYIIKYAKYFGVSADYLLGLSIAPTVDKDVQFVCDYVGLSQESVEKLANKIKGDDSQKMVNALISQDFLYLISKNLIKAFNNVFSEKLYCEVMIKKYRENKEFNRTNFNKTINKFENDTDLALFKVQNLIFELCRNLTDDTRKDIEILLEEINTFSVTNNGGDVSNGNNQKEKG